MSKRKGGGVKGFEDNVRKTKEFVNWGIAYSTDPTSDKKLASVDFVVSVVVTFRAYVNTLISNTVRRHLYCTSTVGRKLISMPEVSRSTLDKKFTSVEKVAQGSGQSD